jgi:hypothetical protein
VVAVCGMIERDPTTVAGLGLSGAVCWYLNVPRCGLDGRNMEELMRP